MLKFAFLIMMPELKPETFRGVYENKESYNLVVGMDSIQAAEDIMKGLIADGYTLFNLCSGFTPEDAEMLQAMGDGIKVRAADYLPAEGEKIEKLEDFSKYGVVVVMSGVEETETVSCSGPDFDAEVKFVKDQEAANAAAAELAEHGVTFIELCSWFTEERTQAVADAIGGAVPVGSAGLL